MIYQWIASLRVGTWLVISIAIMLLNGAVQAEVGESRGYLDVQYSVLKLDSESFHLDLKPFIRVENRFRNSGLVYQQWNTGVRFRVFSWASVAAYYTPRELFGTSNTFKNTVGADLVFHPTLGQFRLTDRLANEWHITDKYYRFRNLSEVLYQTPVSWLSLFAYDEFRADGDQGRINMNNLGGGLQIDPKTTLTVRLFFDNEGNRRKLDKWQHLLFAGLSCAVHL